MAMFPNSSHWAPKLQSKIKPSDVIVFSTSPELRGSAWQKHGQPLSLTVANFLEMRRPDSDSVASYLYVSLSRLPTEDFFEVTPEGPIEEFGYGEYPRAPEHWESIPIYDLLRLATEWLRASN